MRLILPKLYNLGFEMKAKQENFNKGRYGEDLALQYLLKKGYELVDQNYSTEMGPKGELDLIMRDGDRLVFIEVKYKYNDRLGIPEEMIGKSKLAQVKRIAQIYVVLEKPKEEKFRIDAECILGDKLNLLTACLSNKLAPSVSLANSFKCLFLISALS